MIEPADNQNEPDNPVQHDHQDCHHGVAGERRIGLAAEHDGRDQRHLDRDHRDRQNQRPVWLAQQRCQMIRMAHCRKGQQQHRDEKNGEQDAVKRRSEDARKQPRPGSIGKRRDQQPNNQGVFRPDESEHEMCVPLCFGADMVTAI